ncbi:HAD family hydrolase [Thermaerobacter sp. PB12/4term]|uniref:HAD family hydrolase n=1 Tax=Thermaerobacter sp. PB12/4term TaxID=2293838 RepID=UPI000E32CC49|nr:HAD family hydrolase [Thermaerobacter sp. PB12/4term]QIA26729.1 HAD family hydrolase [Thermaerobacter sp. PB12/4term]
MADVDPVVQPAGPVRARADAARAASAPLTPADPAPDPEDPARREAGRPRPAAGAVLTPGEAPPVAGTARDSAGAAPEGAPAAQVLEGPGGPIEAVLFDLDGTLLELDMDRFLPVYLQRLAAWVADLFDPEDFLRQLVRATTAVMQNRDRSQRNQDLLWEVLWAGLDPARHPGARPERRDEALARFEQFYREQFPQLQFMARRRPEAAAVVEAARARGWKVVLATSPIFPMVAIAERLRWAGLSADRFDLVTVLENMHSCKPQPDYYLEVARRIGVEPGRCLMVGNDLRDDIAPARVAGMAVYVVEGLVLHEGEPGAAGAPRGTLAQLLQLFVKNGANGNIFAKPETLHGNNAALE